MIEQACAALGVREVQALRDGGQKTVRLVERDDYQYVLKVISLGGTNPQALQRAGREVELLQKLDSPFVVRAASDLRLLGPDDGPPTGAAWLEEHLDGSDLDEGFGGAAWEWDDARRLGVQVAQGLGAMHAHRVVHRDLSANNIRCLTNGDFKVMDPGAARHELLPPITLHGHPGTPGYCSPEHLRQPPAGPSTFSDVFCLGILVWTAALGSSPIPYEGDLNDYLSRLSQVQLADQKEAHKRLGDDRFAFLLTCLHRQPARRFRDGNAAAVALEEL